MQALGDVDSRFRFGERTQLRSAGDSLLQSAQFPPVQNGREFGLPTQHDLQNLFLMRVRVSEKADLLKQFGRQQMRFVNDQRRRATLPVRIEYHPLECREPPGFTRGCTGNLKFVHQCFQKLLASQRWVKDQRCAHFRVVLRKIGKDLQRRVHQCGLTGSDGASDHD